jgi:hypothetical protein
MPAVCGQPSDKSCLQSRPIPWHAGTLCIVHIASQRPPNLAVLQSRECQLLTTSMFLFGARSSDDTHTVHADVQSGTLAQVSGSCDSCLVLREVAQAQP